MSVGTKARKKQSPKAAELPEAALPAPDQALEASLLKLENTCLHVLETRFVSAHDDMDALYWQQRFKNIATPVSLALREYKGPRRFHNHYRHREDDETVLRPVLEDPLEMLAHACETALSNCRSELVGIPDDGIARKAQQLEQALAGFLKKCEEVKAEAV